MKTIPILFSTPMVEAFLNDTKTQTRRLNFEAEVGDILWVRETFQLTTWEHPLNENYGYIYRASQNGRDWEENNEGWTWKPSIFMPKEACRLFLEVTEKRAEPLQNITEADAIAEGVAKFDDLEYINYLKPLQFTPTARASFQSLWQKINGTASWQANPEIKAYTFKRVDKPANFL
ncbi:MAG: hypothetical protein ACM31G_07205 [Flavobacteriales bacterium]